jgi:dTDP-4-dehydrorhamnose reductase
MKTVLIGADGQLGTDLLKQEKNLIPLTITDIDITNLSQVEQVLGQIKPEVVINTAAYNNVERAEEEPNLAFAVNALGAENLALICRKLDAALVHFSTDYVFSGQKSSPYLENDLSEPTSAYGKSKLEGEKKVADYLSKYFIVRTSGLFGAAGCMGKGGTNFVEGMINKAKPGQSLRVVNDEIFSPTYSYDLAAKVLQIISKKYYGTYHITNGGQCSWYEFAEKIFELLMMKVDLSAITMDEYKTGAKRPKFSVLGHGHLKMLGMDDLRSWEEALKAYLRETERLPLG